MGAGRAFLVIKRRFEREIAILARALLDLRRADLLGDFVIQLVLVLAVNIGIVIYLWTRKDLLEPS